MVGDEYVLRWLEPGAHRWEQFVTPIELTGLARAAGLRRRSLRNLIYDPFRSTSACVDTGMNYLFAATKAEVRFEARLYGAAASGWIPDLQYHRTYGPRRPMRLAEMLACLGNCPSRTRLSTSRKHNVRSSVGYSSFTVLLFLDQGKSGDKGKALAVQKAGRLS